jgi:hypothetical protein
MRNDATAPRRIDTERAHKPLTTSRRLSRCCLARWCVNCQRKSGTNALISNTAQQTCRAHGIVSLGCPLRADWRARQRWRAGSVFRGELFFFAGHF